MDPQIDPQTIQLMLLLSQAKGGNKNLSGILNNMDNPLFTALAGAFDPQSYYGGPGGVVGSKWQQYASSDMPVVHDIMDKIQQGVDNRWLSSYVESLPASGVDMAGFQVSDLKGLANDLYKEHNSGTGGGKGDAFSKAGLRSPMDVYDAETVPLGDVSMKKLSELQAQYESTKSKYSTAAQGSKKASLLIGGPSKDKRKKWADVAISTSESGLNVAERELELLSDWIKKTENISIDDIEQKAREITADPDMSWNKPISYSYDDTPHPKGYIRPILKKAIAALKNPTVSSSYDQNKADQAKAVQDWESSKAQENQLRTEMSNNARLQEAIRMASLQKAAAAGRTPFTDQMSQIMRFASGSK